MSAGPNHWLLRFGELSLKSRPVRSRFQKALIASLLDLAIQNDIDLVVNHIGQLHVASSNSEVEIVEDVLRHCFGLVAADPATSYEINPEKVAQAALQADPRRGEERTFGVRTKRSGQKGEYTSQSFSGEVGYHMLQGDDSLSVNLRHPDVPVKVTLTAQHAWLLGDRVVGAGGLPTGVQGRVLVKLSSERDMLGAWQLMRRGCRAVPLPDSDEELLAVLSRWDPVLKEDEEVSRRRSGPGSGNSGVWGVIGMSIEEAEEYAPLPIGAKNTPMATLDPLCGWNDAEIQRLGEHVRNPSQFPAPGADREALNAWIA